MEHLIVFYLTPLLIEHADFSLNSIHTDINPEEPGVYS